MSALTAATSLFLAPVASASGLTHRSAHAVSNCSATGGLINGGFEATGTGIFTASAAFGWSTTATDNKVEVWPSGQSGVNAAEGSRFLEMNANMVANIYQDISTTPGQTLTISFYHRGRLGVDVAKLYAATSSAKGKVDNATLIGTYADGNTSWGKYSASYVVPTGQTTTELIFQSFSNVGPASYGNLLDGVQVQNCSGAPSAPNAPTSVAASMVSGSTSSATVTWVTPTSDGGAPISGYTVTANPGSISCTVAGNANSCTLSGLVASTTYSVSVSATNAAGTSAASAAASLVVPGVPGAPSAVSFSSGEDSRLSGTLSWTAPSNNGGSAITGYTVTSSPSGKGCTTTGSTSCSISGLARGTTYTFTVVAINALGTGASASSSAYTTTSAPDAPTNVSATAGNGSASVSWTAPSSKGNDQITGYTVTASPGGKTCTTSDTSCTISGLTRGASYIFTVIATNATGNSVSSSASSSITLNDVPGAPTALSVSISKNSGGDNGDNGSGSSKATVSWTAPSTTGGTSITGYTVTASPGGKTCTSTTTSCSISGLAKGTTYSFSVVATNAVGNSAASTSVSATTTNVPGAPTGVTASFAAGRVTVAWSAPSDNGGDSITGYTVTASPGGKTCTSTTTSCSISTLTLGASYTFTVTATNSTGTSAASAASAATATYGIPAAPTNVNASYANNTITVSWTAPAGVVTSYTLIANNTIVATGITGTSTQVTNFLWNVAYRFAVIATNASGSSSASTASSSLTARDVPNAPSAVTATSSNGSVATSWTASTIRGVVTTGYKVTLSPGGKTCQTIYAVTCTIYGLANGVAYTAAVIATSSLGNSAAGSASPVTPITTSSAPWGPSASVANGVVTISWLSISPYQNGGAAITGYNVYTSKNVQVCANASGTSCTWTGATYGTNYNFYITAVNAAGEGAHSGLTNSVLPVTAPTAVLNPAVSLGNQSALVSWSTPASNGGSVITRYTATATPGGASCTTEASGSSCTISGLTNGSTYSVAVTATNYKGLTSAAAVAGSVTPATVTWRPTKANLVSVGNGNATVTWAAPANFGGATPTSYVITLSPGNRVFTATYPATSATITGLTAGTSYSVTVAAVNAAGTSFASNASNALIPTTIPAVPSIESNSSITVQPDYYGNYSGTMVVNLVAPSDWGFSSGSTVGSLNLTVTSPTGTIYNGSVPVTRNSDGSLTYTNSFSFGPLPLYTTYTVTASATNASGSSPSVSTQLSSTGPIVNASAQGTYNASTQEMTWSVIPSVSSDSINYVLTVNGQKVCSGKASEVTHCVQSNVALKLAPAATPTTPIASIPFNVTQSVAGVQTGSSDYVMNLYYLTCGTGQTHCSSLAGSYYRVDNGSLVNMNLSGLDLRGAGFYTSDLSGVSLNGDKVQGAQFNGDNLTGLSAWGSDFSNTFWTNNNLSGTRFVNASWQGADNKNLSGTPLALCATSTSITPNWSQYPAVSDLANETKNCFVYKGALITTGAKIVNVDLSGLNVSGMNLSTSQFTGDNLSNANFAGTDLSNATLRSDIVTGADFTGTTWFHASAAGLTGAASVVTSGYRVVSGYLAGPNLIIAFSNLSGLDFSNLDLSGTTFLNDDMRGANFTNDVFAQSFLGQVILPGSGLTNPNLLTGANFTNADLSGVLGLLASFSGQVAGSFLNVGGSAPAQLPTSMTYVGGQLIAL